MEAVDPLSTKATAERLWKMTSDVFNDQMISDKLTSLLQCTRLDCPQGTPSPSWPCAGAARSLGGFQIVGYSSVQSSDEIHPSIAVVDRQNDSGKTKAGAVKDQAKDRDLDLEEKKKSPSAARWQNFFQRLTELILLLSRCSKSSIFF